MSALVLTSSRSNPRIYIIPISPQDEKDVIIFEYQKTTWGHMPSVIFKIDAPQNYIILKESLVNKAGGIEKVIKKIKSGEFKFGKWE